MIVFSDLRISLSPHYYLSHGPTCPASNFARTMFEAKGSFMATRYDSERGFCPLRESFVRGSLEVCQEHTDIFASVADTCTRNGYRTRKE